MTTTQRDQEVPGRVVVRVLDTAGAPVGAGFVIGPDLVATCAHVLAAAMRGDPYGAAAPAQSVDLDFPLLFEAGLDGPARVTAEVARWIPIAPDGSGDIAVLRVRDPLPDGARMPPLRRVDQLWDHPFRVLGFPAGLADGVWATGRLRSRQGTRWFQMQGSVGEQPIERGFSGSPVWEEDSGAVVGMTVASDVGGTTTAYLVPIDQVLGVDPELLPCPYRGLEPFGEEHTEYFFGREDDVDRLVDVVGRRRLVAVTGPSGAGKSSLVRAGLLPRLRAQGVAVAELRPLPGHPMDEALQAALHAADGPRTRLVLVVDQFEELAATDPHAARELLERVGELVRSAPDDGRVPVHAVVTLRSATIDEVVVPELAGMLGEGTVLVPAMNRRQLRDAIVAPAERAPGLSFEPGLVDRILDDAAAEPGRLPLVESLLTELWTRREGGNLTLRAYEEAGGVAGVVATHAEAVVAGAGEPVDGPQLRRLLTALAGPDRDGRFVRRPLRWAEVAPDLRPLVLRLAAGRLLVVARAADGQETIQLAHQALIAHWPRLRDWLTEDRDFLAWREQLGQQRERWEAVGRDDGALLRGTGLATALDQLPAREADVPAADIEFVRLSRVRQRREVRRWRAVTAVLAVLVLAAATLSVVAVDRGNALREQLDIANAELLAQAALARAATDPVTSTQLALAAWRLDPNNLSARSALLRQYVAMRSVDGVVADVAEEQIIAFVVSRDGRMMTQADSSGFVVTRLADGPPQRHVLPGSPPLNSFRAARMTDRFVVVMDSTGAVLLWDLTMGGGPQTISGPTPAISDYPPIGFSDDEHLVWLEPGPTGAELRIWNVVTNTPVPHGIGPIQEPNVVRVALTADLTRVMIQVGDTRTGRVDGPTIVRSLADGALVSTLPEHTVLIDRGVATCTPPGPDATSPAVAVITGLDLVTPLRRLPLEEYICSDFDRMFTRDGQHLADRIGEPSDVDVVRIRDITDGSAYEVSLPPDPNTATDDPRWTLAEKMTVLPGPDGTRTVVVPHDTSLLRLTAVPNPHIHDTFDRPSWLGLSPDGRTSVASTEGGYATFDRASNQPLAELSEEVRNAWSVFPANVDERLTLRWIPTEDGGVWIAEYSLPALEPVLRVEPPARPGKTLSALDTDVVADRIYALGDGLLTGWDRTTGAPLGPPVDLAVTPEREESFSRLAVIKGRPGHPGEAAVVGPQNAIEIWDVERGTHLTTLPQENGSWSHGFAFDGQGARLASVTNTGTLEVRDVDRGELIGTPIPIERGEEPVGIAADGTVVTAGNAPGLDEHLTFWDMTAGRASGSVRTAALGPKAEIVDGTYLDVENGSGYVNGALPHRMALTPQLWADALCRFSKRPFTDTELAALPKGSTISPPC